MSHEWSCEYTPEDLLEVIDELTEEQAKMMVINKLQQITKRNQVLEKENEQLKKQVKELDHNAKLHRQGLKNLFSNNIVIPKP